MALTIKQERFCHKYIETGNASEAYRFAYDAENMSVASIKQEAYMLMQNPDISLTINNLREQYSKKHMVTVESLTKELEEARELARQKEEASPMISASMGKAKLHGIGQNKLDELGIAGSGVKEITVRFT